jgi:hypothetical protein
VPYMFVCTAYTVRCFLNWFSYSYIMLIFWHYLFGACRLCASSPLTEIFTYFGVFLHILLNSLTALVCVGVMSEQFNYGILRMWL